MCIRDRDGTDDSPAQFPLANNSSETMSGNYNAAKQADTFMDSIVALSNSEMANCWYDIIITANLNHTVTEYSVTLNGAELLQNNPGQTAASVPKKELEPGPGYKRFPITNLPFLRQGMVRIWGLVTQLKR